MKHGTADFYSAAINALIRFINQDNINISKIDTEFLRKFKSFIETEPSQQGSNRKKTTKKNVPKGRAVSAYLTCIRAIYNRARDKYNDEDRGIINIPFYPFKKISIKQEQRTRKRALTIEQIQSIINLPYENEIVGGRWSRFNLAKDCFLISFGLVGMNSADLYYCKSAKNGVITYNRQKTKDRRDDNAEMKIKIEGCIQSLVDKYKDNERLFTFHRHYADTHNFNRAINKGLKQIGKKLDIEDLEFYAARHSWATIARSSAVGIDKATVHEALNHVDDKMKITDIYIDRDWKVIWEANKKVLELFDWSAVL
jgi:integrase